MSAPEPREKRDCPMHTQLHQIVADMADRRGDAPALTFKDETRHLRRAVRERAMRFAAGLQRARAAPRRARRRSASTSGSRRSCRSSGPRRPAASFVPVNPVLKAEQVGLHPAATAACACWSRPPQRLDAAARGARRQRRRARDRGRRRARGRGPAGPRVPRVRGRGLRGGARARIDVDMAAILYTSGSTGKPKGVVLSPPQPDRRRRERQPVPRQHAPTTSSWPRCRSASTPASAS